MARPASDSNRRRRERLRLAKPGARPPMSTSGHDLASRGPDARAQDAKPRPTQVAERAIHRRGVGMPLQPSVRRRLERGLGRDFGHVRIHDDRAAHRATEALGARAFTHRHHIWLGKGASASNTQLMAHEATHVVQQGAAPRQRAARNARAGGARGAVARARPRPSAPMVQRFDLWGAARRAGGAVVSSVRSVAGGAVELASDVAGGLLDMGREALLAVVRRVAPDFLRLFEGNGLRGFLRDVISRGFRALFQGAVGRLRGLFSFGGLGGRFAEAAQRLLGAAAQLARNDCSAVFAAARGVSSFFGRVFRPVIEPLRGMARGVASLFRGVVDAVGARVMPFLQRIGGSIWQSLRGFIGDVGAVIRRVKNALGSAWQRVKGWFGIEAEDGTAEGGGLWNWVRDKASEVWDQVKGPLRPVLGPLRVVGGVLIALSPAGPILAVIYAWPHLRRAFGWIRDRWRDLNLVVRARQFFTATVLPRLIETARGLRDALLSGADWLLGLLTRVASSLSRALGGVGSGLLAPLRSVLGFVNGHFQRLLTWARGGLRRAARGMGSLLRRLILFLQPVLRFFLRLLAIVVNPFGIGGLIAGSLWSALPNCLKGPVIDFLIGIVRRFLTALPPLPMLGLLWPLVRNAMVGFLERLQRFAVARKVAVTNKIATIISGGSVGFALGFLRGLITGVWEAVIGPFQALVDLFRLPDLIRRFVAALGLDFRSILQRARRFASSLSDRAVGTYERLLGAARDLIRNPGRVIEMLSSAIQAAMQAVRGLGARLAERMMALFEGPDSAIGLQLGQLAGGFVVQAVLAYFTAGTSTAASAISTVARLLGTVARNVMRVLRQLAGLFRRFLGVVRRLGRRFRQAGSRAGGILGRIRGFFQRVAAWFRRMMGRLRGRRRRRGRDRDRDGRSNRAARERRKQRVIRILRARLQRGIGALRLRALLTYLKLRHRIRRLRMRRDGRGRRTIIIRNSAQEEITAYERIWHERRGTPREYEYLSTGAAPNPLQGRPSGIIHSPGRVRRSATSLPTPRQILLANYRPAQGSELRRRLSRVDTQVARPNWVEVHLDRTLPGFIRPLRQSILGGVLSQARGVAARARHLGIVEEYLKTGNANESHWNAGHLVANELAGPWEPWNFVPMTVELNRRVLSRVEDWLRRQFQRIRGVRSGRRGRDPRAELTYRVSAEGYDDSYEPDASVLPRAQTLSLLGDRLRGFVPRAITANVTLQSSREMQRVLRRDDRNRNVRRAQAGGPIGGPDDVNLHISPPPFLSSRTEPHRSAGACSSQHRQVFLHPVEALKVAPLAVIPRERTSHRKDTMETIKNLLSRFLALALLAGARWDSSRISGATAR